MNVSTLKCWGRSVLFFLMLTTFVPSVAKDVYGFMTAQWKSTGDVFFVSWYFVSLHYEHT